VTFLRVVPRRIARGACLHRGELTKLLAQAAFEKAAKEGDAAKAALAAKGGSSTPPAEPAAAAPEASPAPAAAQPSGDAK
jgi:hypothetical protein